MILDPRFQQALEGTLTEAEWQKLASDRTLRQALADQMRMDVALRVAFETGEDVTALEEAVIASAQTADSGELEARILASTQMRSVKPMRPMWHYHAFAAAAALVLLVGGVLVWLRVNERTPALIVQAQPSPVSVPLTTPVVQAPEANTNTKPVQVPVPAISDEPRKSMIPTPFEQTRELPQRLAARPMEKLPPPELIGTVAPPPKQMPVTVTSKVLSNPDEAQASVSVITLPSQGEKVEFEKHILPMLERSCFECHSAKVKKPKGGIRLDDLAAIRAKSKTDNLVFPHKPERSTLLKSVSLPGDDDNFMPPTGKGQALSAEEIAVLKRWVEEGANFGAWTSARAKMIVIKTKDEAVDATNVQNVARRIDELLVADLHAHNQPLGEPASDSVFVRRVYLDLIGRIPSFVETRKFLDDKSADKRAKLIDTLLASNGHISHMFNFWADLLRAREELADEVDGKPYLMWIKQSIRDNKSYDQWVREMLSPEGFGWKAPAAGYYLRDGANRPANIESTATLFLGTQISCAQCHDHPFDQWTRMDYHQFLAFTSGIKASNDDSDVGMVSNETVKTVAKRYDRLSDHGYDMERKAKYQALADKVRSMQATAGGAGVVNGDAVTAMVPADYQYGDAKPGEAINPKVLYGAADAAAATRPADALAQWVTAPTNVRFNLAIANRLWTKLFGLPFAGRMDQIKELADCDNSDLAAYLANVVRDSRYDLRQMLRILTNTQAYQNRAHLAPEGDEEYRFPSPIVRRLSAEQVWDSMMALAVNDLDSSIDMQGPDIAKLEEAANVKKASELSKIARQLVGEEQRKADAEARKNRKLGELAVEFAGGSFERASELPQPTPPGHFLRMFGQGNRDFIGDAWNASTVPQALLMMNSQFFEHVGRSGSPLSNALRGTTNPKEIVKNAFLAVLSREPTNAEIAAAFETIGETRNPKNLARTLLTTAEFVFQK